MKIGIFLNFVGLGANLLHLSYCHEIAKRHGPVTIVTLCKNLKQALEDDPLIKDVLLIDKKNKRILDIFKLSSYLKKLSFKKLFIFYPSLRTYLAAKIANIDEINSYSFFKKKNLHLVDAAKEFTEKYLNIKNCPTETNFFVSKKKNEVAKEIIKKNHYNIVIGAGSSGPTTKWGEKNYIQLINKLNLNNDYFFYILCGPNEKEISDKIISNVKKKNCQSLSQKNISQLIPIISSCDMYIGNDSFGHHITSQCGIPSLVIILDTPKAYTDYSINQYRIIPKGTNLKNIKHDTAFNPNLIKVDQIYKKVLELKIN